jgi:hypothetical protein
MLFVFAAACSGHAFQVNGNDSGLTDAADACVVPTSGAQCTPSETACAGDVCTSGTWTCVGGTWEHQAVDCLSDATTDAQVDSASTDTGEAKDTPPACVTPVANGTCTPSEVACAPSSCCEPSYTCANDKWTASGAICNIVCASPDAVAADTDARALDTADACVLPTAGGACTASENPCNPQSCCDGPMYSCVKGSWSVMVCALACIAPIEAGIQGAE